MENTMNNTLSYLMNILFFERRYFLFFFIHPLFKSLFFIFPPWCARYFSDLLQSGKGLDDFFILFSLWYFFYFVYGRLYNYFFQVKFYSKLKKETSLVIMKNVLYNSKTYFSSYPPAEVVHLLIHLNENTIDLTKLLIDGVLPIIMTLVGLFVFLLSIYPAMGILYFVWISVILYLSYSLIIFLKKDIKSLARHKSKFSEAVFDVLENNDTVRAFFGQENEINLLENKVEKIESQEVYVASHYQKISLQYFFSFILLNAFVCIVYLYFYSEDILYTKFFLMWITIAMNSYNFAESLLDYTINLPRYFYSIEEGLEVLTISDKNHPSIVSSRGEGKIEFQNVCFTREGKEILKNVSFNILPREKIAIVGFSGSGKSTVLFLLLRMYTPTSGKILIDDIDIGQLSEEHLYSLFGVVLQKNSIFNRSVKENIFYPKRSQTKEEIANMERLSKIFGIFDLIENKDHSVVSRLARSYSGGEQQRIAIARALLKNAPIILLDEPTGNVDVISENKILEEIFCESQSKSIIMVTHNLASLKYFDRILVFESGELVEQGTHSDLIQTKGSLYERLHYVGKVI
jgi:ATP-binding cassette subfamily B protein